MQTNDPFDATVTQISFVVRRAPNRSWAIRNLVNRHFHIMAFAASGRAQYQCGDRHFEVDKGHLLFFPKGTPHSGRSDPATPWSFYSTTFELLFANPHSEETLLGLPTCSMPVNTAELQALFSELERLWVGREGGFLLRCRSIILHLLHTHLRACCSSDSGVPHSGKLGSIVALLQANSARTFSIEELAERVDLSPSRFRVLFKQYTGHSVVRYQNWLRINKAKDLLRSGEYSVADAAREVGFADVYYFSRLFKKLTGTNPSYCRNR